jgi:hypothetical protein
MNTARVVLGGAGTQTAGLGFGGNIPPVTGATEEYNGTSWTTTTSMNTTRIRLGGAGIQTAALAFAGNDGTANTAATEEWTQQAYTGIKTITVS